MNTLKSRRETALRNLLKDNRNEPKFKEMIKTLQDRIASGAKARKQLKDKPRVNVAAVEAAAE